MPKYIVRFVDTGWVLGTYSPDKPLKACPHDGVAACFTSREEAEQAARDSGRNDAQVQEAR